MEYLIINLNVLLLTSALSYIFGKFLLKELPKLNRYIETKRKEKTEDFIDYEFNNEDIIKFRNIFFILSLLTYIGIFYFNKFNLTDTIYQNLNGIKIHFSLIPILIPLLSIQFLVDFKYMELPDSINLAILCTTVLNVFLSEETPFSILMEKFIVAFVIFIIFILIALLFGGVGGGDIKYVFCIGFLFNMDFILKFLLIAFFIGAIQGIYLLIFKKKKLEDKFCFGPSIILATLILFL